MINGESGGIDMSAKERIFAIKEIIKKEKKVTVSDLSRKCNVTEETIRKDLTKLETEGLVTRIHGGAILKTEQAPIEGIHYFNRQAMNVQEKQIIAQKAIRLLEGKSTIIADSSTTVAEALKAIPNKKDITIVTNSTEAFREFIQSDVNIISTGGEFNKKSLSLQGYVAKANIQKYSVDIALLSCKALDLERGVQDSNEGEAEIKKLMLEQAAEVALLVDHTKFDRTAFVCLLSLDKVDYIVTDMRPDDKWIKYCSENQIQLIFE